ncbi:MAG TPA: branched-chain amino acid ABC transporter permease [Microbacterium sp.]|jgi:branched-chain amino acid transport system permease protein|nr:branched-chain amino acid ABC transporter permease [Microbacterium sp.]
MTKLLQLIIIGTALGAIYGLLALGFTLVYKATRVFNFAQGDLMMLGAYILVSFSVTDLQLSPWLAIPLTLLMSIPVGILFQFLFVRPLIGQPFLPVVMATIGAALIIQAGIQMYWGVIELPYQTVFPSRVFDVEGVRVSSFDLITIAVAAACVALFALFFKLTKIGLQMRAAAENNEAAILSGINVHRVSLVAWSIGTLLAFIAGVILANQQGTVTFSLTGLALLAFPAVVIGGLESIPGAVVGGLIVGILQALIAGYYDPLAQDALVFAALLLMLLVKPTGLFGQKEIVRV